MTRQLFSKLSLTALATIATIALISAPSRADEAKTTFNIPAQDLGTALREFARQSNQEILFSTEIVHGKRTAGVKGAMSEVAALTKLLAGSGLVIAKSANGTTLITTPDAKEASGNSGPPIAPTGAGPNETTTSAAIEAQRTASLEEVIVSAQKREERLQDVPVPVSVINANSLINNNEVLLRDYYSSVPGLSMTTTTQSSQILALRGIVSNPGNPTVGITVDDVPFGSSTIAGGGLVVPDFDPGDLSQIEVLRGPQGTLYGASSLGGLIKFVTLAPSTSGVSGSLMAGGSSVYNGDEVGYVLRGAVNASA